MQDKYCSKRAKFSYWIGGIGIWDLIIFKPPYLNQKIDLKIMKIVLYQSQNMKPAKII